MKILCLKMEKWMLKNFYLYKKIRIMNKQLKIQIKDREAGVGIRQAVEAVDALLLALIAVGEPIAQHQLSIMFAKGERILDEGIEFELAARRRVNELVAEEERPPSQPFPL